MKATNDVRSIVGKVLTKIDERNEQINLVPETITKRLNDSSSDDLEFRPLTEQEKKEFVNSLNIKGRQESWRTDQSELHGSSRGQSERCSFNSES